MKYVWQLKYYYGKKRMRATDYITSGEFNTLEEAMEFKEKDKELRLNQKDEEMKLLEIIEDKGDYIRYHHVNCDVVFELHKISDNHKYQYQLDDGTWVREE